MFVCLALVALLLECQCYMRRHGEAACTKLALTYAEEPNKQILGVYEW